MHQFNQVLKNLLVYNLYTFNKLGTLPMDIIRQSILKQTDYILCSQRRKDLYSQQKQDQELTVAQIMKSLLPNSDLN